jgi:hypothetical protein
MDGPMAVLILLKGDLHANRFWTCSNEEGGLCLRLLDARGGAQPRVHLRSHRRPHYARNVEIRSRNNGSSDQTIACSTVDEFVRLTLDLRGRQQRAWATPLPNTEEERGTMEPVYG